MMHNLYRNSGIPVPILSALLLSGCVAYFGPSNTTAPSAELPRDVAEETTDLTPREVIEHVPTDVTPLHEAAAKGQLDTVRRLAAMGADLNARDSDRQTPLHYAASHGHGQTTVTLIELGANPWARDIAGKAPRYYAELNGHNGTAASLPDRATTPLHEVAANGDPKGVEKFADRAVDINALDGLGRTPLHRAAANGHAATVSLLIRLGADTEIQDDAGYAARDYALANNHGGTAGAIPEARETVAARNPAHQSPNTAEQVFWKESPHELSSANHLSSGFTGNLYPGATNR